MLAILSLDELLEAIEYYLGDFTLMCLMTVLFVCVLVPFSAGGTCCFCFRAKKQMRFSRHFFELSKLSDELDVFRTSERWNVIMIVLPRRKRDLREELGNLANATPGETNFEKACRRNVLRLERTVVAVV